MSMVANLLPSIVKAKDLGTSNYYSRAVTGHGTHRTMSLHIDATTTAVNQKEN
jgi:hypothetical protein